MRKPQNLTNTRQYGKTFRVEFTLTKLQEDLPEQKARDKLLVLTNFFFLQKQQKQNTLSFRQNQPGRSTRQGSAKVVQIKNKFRQSAVRQTFQTDLDNYYYLLKDERVLFFYLLHSLSRTNQLKIQKLCHNPTKTTKRPQVSR